MKTVNQKFLEWYCKLFNPDLIEMAEFTLACYLDCNQSPRYAYADYHIQCDKSIRMYYAEYSYSGHVYDLSFPDITIFEKWLDKQLERMKSIT